MPKVIFRKAFIQLIVLMILCICHDLITLSYAQTSLQYYIVDNNVDTYKTMGIYKIQDGKPVLQKVSLGDIQSIAVWEKEIYYIFTNGNMIYKMKEKKEIVVFDKGKSTEYIRDIAFDAKGYLYYSEASGKDNDGVIYKLNPQKDGKFSSTKYYVVSLRDVDGFWGGNFTFNKVGDLYLSTGTYTPAYIYEVTKKKDGTYDPPKKIYRAIDRTKQPISMRDYVKDLMGYQYITGIAINSNEQNSIYYADGKQSIYSYKLDGKYLSGTRVFTFSNQKARLSDIAFDMKYMKESFLIKTKELSIPARD